MDYLFLGNSPRIYEFFTAQPHEIKYFASPADVPTDGMWAPLPSDAKKPVKKTDTTAQEN